MKEMTYEELRVVQLDILQFIHDFCVANDIRYSLAYGTLLGAVRHGGYIPWDDDIDIAMLREDYEKFLQLFAQEKGIYTIAEARLDPQVNISFAKVYDNRTLILEGGNTKNLGIFVDIFPIDDMYDTYEESVKYFHSFDKYRLLQKVKGRELKIIKEWWKKPIVAILKLCFLKVNIHEVVIKYTNRICSRNSLRTNYVSLLVDGECKDYEIMESTIWESFEPICFEGKTFLAVQDKNGYLEHAYGDYMKLPPKEQQVPKHDFDAIYWKE